MTNIEGVVVFLIRKALNPDLAIEIPADTNWEKALDFAISQGVLGLCFEAVEKLLANQRPPLEMLMQWYGHTEQQKAQYERSWAVACKLDRLWASEGILATILKGRSIAQYYPVPSHRYSCDLDVFIEHDWERACELLEKKGILLEHEVYKEVEFTIDGVYVECHRYITPVRGNKHLQKVEMYLRALLRCEPKACFEGTSLACPPMMFNAILFVEHALGDFQHGNLTLKHLVDWVLLRRQAVNWDVFEMRCKEFKFDRFVALINALADVIEGKTCYESLPLSYREAFDEIFQGKASEKPRSWFQRRVNLFFDIIKNSKKFSRYGYTSMPSFLFNSVWTHFFDKEVRVEGSSEN